jgi:S1-C subfamily serine protease
MERRGFGGSTIALTVILALVFGLVGGGAGAYLYMSAHPPVSDGGGAIVSPPDGGATVVRVATDQEAIVQAVGKVNPAVVKIVATSVVESSDPFEFFFGGGSRLQRGVGSGFLFEDEGRKLVLTNTHVVGDAQEISVQLLSGDKLVGKLLAADRSSDVAIVELDGDLAELPVATLGDSDELALGEWVVAIGHPYALFDHTVTVGVVSAQGPRQVGGAQGNGMVRNVIQTDAAINQGNSGGPLVDLAGNVVGINSMIYSPTGASVGIGFAIPINDAKQIMHFLLYGGPWVGIQRVLPNSEGLANYLRLQTADGVVVVSLWGDSPAAQAGMKQGDVILTVDGDAVSGPEELRHAIFSHEIGETINFGVQRGSEPIELPVVAGQVPRGQYSR